MTAPPRPARALSGLVLPLLLAAADARQEGEAQEPEPRVPVLELTVVEAVALALGNNLDVRIAEVQAEVARFDSLGTWGTFDWIFDASATVSTETEEGSGFLSGGEEVETDVFAQFVGLSKETTVGGSFNATFGTNFSDTNNVFANNARQLFDTLTLSYVQPLRRGAWSRYATSQQREAEMLFHRAVEGQRQSRQDIAYAVHVAYWDLVSAIEQRGVAESAVDLAENQLEQEQREFDAGVGTQIDVVQARVEVATRSEALLRTQNAVVQRMDDLRALLFVSQDDRLWEMELVPTTGLPEEASAEGVPDWTTALLTALEMRSELRQRRIDVDVARERHQRATSERLYGLDLTLEVSSAAVDASGGEALEESLGLDYPRYAAVLSYNMPIGNRTAANAERAAEAEVRRAQLEYEREELNVTTSVRTALRNVLFAVEQVRAASTSLELARRQLAAEEARQAEGMSTTFQVLEFQQALIEAMSNERLTRAGFVKALAELQDAQGLLAGEDQ